MTIIDRIISERAVLLLVLVLLTLLVATMEIMGSSLSEFGRSLVLIAFGFFFGQSSPARPEDVNQLG